MLSFRSKTLLNWFKHSTRPCRKPSLELEALEDRSVPAVRFLGLDAGTQGSWEQAFGRDGLNVPSGASALPDYATVSIQGGSEHHWNADANDPRVLDGYKAVAWQGFSITFDVNITDGQNHRLALYLVDWSKTGRTERVESRDATTGQVFDSQLVSDFKGGNYLVYDVSGHATFQLTAFTGSAAFLGGVFFGLPAVTSSGQAPQPPTLAITRPDGVYSGSSFPATVTVAGTNGSPGTLLEGVSPTVAYYAGSAASGQPLAGAPTLAGTYTVLASFPGSTSYAAATLTKTFAIQRATPQLSVAGSNITYSGNPDAASAAVAGVSGTFASSLDGVQPGLTYYAGTTATGSPLAGAPVNAGKYTVVANFAGSTSYQPASASATFTIAKANPAIAIADPSATYDGAAHGASAIVTGVGATSGTTLDGASLSFTYYAGSTPTGTPLAGPPSAAGTYTVVATFPGSTNYTNATASRSYTISRASPSLIVTNSGGVYSGNPTNTAWTITGVNGTASASLEGVTPTLRFFAGTGTGGMLLNAAPSNAGTYTVLADFAGSNNYAPVTAATFYTISPATPVLSVTAKSGSYNGNRFPASATITGISGLPSPTLDGVAATFLYYSGATASGDGVADAPFEAGTYVVVASFPGSTNYTAVSGTATFRISPTDRFWTIDTTTHGDWATKYGKDGYAIAGLDTSTLPGYAQIAIDAPATVWAASTTDPSALQNGGSRTASAWSSTSNYSIDITITDGQAHSVALYALDWNNLGAQEFLEFVNVDTNTVVHSFTLQNISKGSYVVYNILGHVKINIARQYEGPALISGLFFGDAYEGAPPPIPPVPNSPPPPPNSPPPPAAPPGVTVSSDWITTPYDKIPNFGGSPTIWAASTGNWSDPATWGGHLPVAGDVVSIPSGVTVTYDQVSDVKYKTVSIEAGGTLRFNTTANTRLRVTNLLVLPGGTLTIGTIATPIPAGIRAEVIINDVPIDTTSDPSQYGNGLIAFGTVRMFGAAQTEGSVALATEARAGSNTLITAAPVTGWSVGDRIIVPDTRQLDDSSSDPSRYVNQLERPTIAAISADGRTITLTSALAYDHLGVRDMDGVLTFLPDIANQTRNVVVRSENASGTRGYTFFTQRADVDIRYTQFTGLGRSTTDNWDNTTYDANGNVVAVGTNQNDRHALTFTHLIGPSTPQADGYQYTFEGNSVFCPIVNMKFRWGVGIQDSQYGLLQGNVIYNWNGGGIVGVDGASVHNSVLNNFVANIRGVGGRTDSRGLGDLGFEGAGIWFRSGLNDISHNTVVDSAYGYMVYSFLTTSVRVPSSQGDDPLISWRYSDMTNVPLQFVGNTVYGGITHFGLELWSVGTAWLGAHDDAQESVIKDFHVWNVLEHAYFGYETNRVTFDGFVFRADLAPMYARLFGITAIYSGDYFQKDFTIRNSDIQGAALGWYPSTISGGGTQTIENTVMRNYVNIELTHLWTSSYDAAAVRDDRTVIIRNVIFGQIPNATSYMRSAWGPQLNIQMKDEPVASVVNYLRTDKLLVYDYNGQAGKNFQIYYSGQDANATMPQQVLNSDGTKQIAGATVSGLTNQQAWSQYGIAVAGAVAPLDAITLDGILGLVEPI